MTGILDTNVVLYLLGGRLAASLPAGEYGVSVITEMELLAWPSLNSGEEEKVQALLAQVTLCDLTAPIRRRAIALRRERQLKIPDAIICATAMEFGVTLWTNDRNLTGIPGLTCSSVRLTTG